MFRAVTLLSSLIAQLLSKPGAVKIVDSEGNVVRSTRARAVLDMLTWSCDGGITDSRTTIEDWGNDYCLGGNTVLVPSVQADGRLTRLRQFRADTARASRLRYDMVEAVPDAAEPETFAARDVIHIRYGIWPVKGAQSPDRVPFGPSPLIAASTALRIGLAMDAYVLNFFNRAGKGTLRNDHAVLVKRRLEDAQLVRFYERLAMMWGSRAPLVLDEEAKIESLRQTPSDSDAEKLRQSQVEEIARLYGLPPVLLGSPVTNWGAGVKQLKSFLFSFSLQQHLGRFTAPLSRRLLPKGQTIRVETYELLRGDIADLVNLIQVGIGGTQNHGFMGRRHALRVLGLPEEWAEEGMDAIPGPEPPAAPARDAGGGDAGGDGGEDEDGEE